MARDRTRRALLGAAATALTLAALCAAAPAAVRTIATVHDDTPISAFHGLLVYSARDTSTGHFALMAWQSGVATAVPIPERAVPFDVDLGPDAEGHTVAVYSRCTTDPPVLGPDFAGPLYLQAYGCRLWSYDFTTRTETVIGPRPPAGARDYRPTIWGDHVAFVRMYARRPTTPYLYIRSPASSVPATRLAGGPRRQCERSDKHRLTCTDPSRSLGPVALDLDADRLAFSWAYSAFGEGLAHQIRIDPLSGTAPVLVAQTGPGGLSAHLLGWATFSAGALFYATPCFGDPSGCLNGSYHLDRYDPVSRATAIAPLPARATFGQARDGDTTFLLTAPDQNGCVAGCTITASSPTFTAAPRRTRP